ncbi:MAG: ABC transporter transmembrane domain-containing protein [Alphaproteobacteria bacterium]|nr:ABC transporter transmembrane domain-containing protein [Alphaproteobacteria bacterium]
MEKTIYGFVFRHSLAQQLFLLALTVASFPVLYVSLELPKQIINDAISGSGFPRSLLGLELGQIEYLMVLSFAFLGLVLLNGAFKFAINAGKGRLGERLLRRLRYDLYSRLLRFPLPVFKRTGQGEIIPMVTQEVEPLGGFMGDALAQPVYQLGILVTIGAFMLIQEPILGLAALALYPFQMYAIPKLQRRVTALAKQRVQHVRRLSDRIGESISTIEAVHADDGSNRLRADIANRLGGIYDIRYEIFRRKFFIKFLNNFLAQLTPFFFYSIGGYLIIEGRLSFGAMVAVLAAYKDMSAPWKELLAYYQQQADARIKYDQVVQQFDPPGMIDEALQVEEAETLPEIGPDSRIAFENAAYAEDEISQPVRSASLSLGLDEHVAIVGPSGGGKEELGLLAARLAVVTGGRAHLDGTALADLPQAVFGRRAAYVGPNASLFNASLRENLLFGLRHRPLRPAEAGPEEAARREARAAEARRSGNSDADIGADWVDYEATGAAPGEEMVRRMVEVLTAVGLDDDLYALGLRGVLDGDAHAGLAGRVLEARKALRSRLDAADAAAPLEPFDADAYNVNATLAENLLFGAPIGPAFQVENLAGHPFVRGVLEEAGLLDRLEGIGLQVAKIMVELFADIDPGHELFQQFSFIDADDLPDFRAIAARADRLGLEGLEAEERERLLGLPFLLIPERHRLGLIDDAIRADLLAARRLFRERLPEADRASVEFFDADRYTARASLQDNILFGRIRHGQAHGAARVSALLGEVVDEVGIRDAVMEAGLAFQVGIGGSRLTQTQRQKLAFARALLKRPALLVVNMATAGVERVAREMLFLAARTAMEGRGIVWVLEAPELAESFPRIVAVEEGRTVEDGTYEALREAGGPFARLLRQ